VDENNNEHAIVNYNATDFFAWTAVVSIPRLMLETDRLRI
jgi:hypothetical protein